ncbi:p-hydroxybenzoate hydroxylase transcriptional activator [Serratia rubidaea]|uniref:p-hydroxybenzoate hydroxylase transcriptional activator n=4 Tax=Serratia rubidaea TaxID=61652 RepID=A0A4U9HJX8_SERRU|nr:IclR family transcriptional regulator C-terminal domain-containing protein [Serratia rubidaea]QPR63347.1 helix-turn-helix domain-containing protein [Serratia rubidaea]CAI0739428.1 p-hydroxybenzoate hydroxylase transcriptional activator [Serratia rubidaea]CAI1546020.1 p-hydroxybenzoate hydroxylase transcriptional activator [Serratia rubidaea]VTP64462.1 p-hydroxybenzoate hydroxylase transcriptional activator [Serratia rubidaea]HAY0635343.1 helix-turn-helix domain-containing protein [Serratia 
MSDMPALGDGELQRLQEIGELSNDKYKGDPNFMASLARGLEVLQAFKPQYSQMSVSEISQITGIPRAAVRRCLYTLKALGFVHCPDGRHYRLLPRVLTVGHAYLSSSELAKTAQNSLDYLSKQLDQSCSVATLDGDNILYIARASVKRIMTIDLGRGSRLPAYATSMGQVLLSALDEPQLEEYLARVTLEPLTPFTVVSEAQLREQLDRVRRQGYAINDQQLEVGLRSIAVPMHSRKGGVVAAMNVGVNASQISAQALRERVLPLLQRTAMDLALLL